MGDKVAIHLTSEHLRARVTPERGADITHLTDLLSGIQLFAESPTGMVTSKYSGWGDSMAHWLNGYPGGWQVLAPNAGPEREWNGVEQGFHGEAALASWQVIQSHESEVQLETFLLTAPLHINRTVTVKGLCLTVTDRFTNLSTEPTSFRLCQHPAFGHPFLDSRSYVETNCRLFIADSENPGSLALPNSSGPPPEILIPGPLPNTVSLPGPSSRESLFGALSEFDLVGDAGSIASVNFVSPSAGVSARVSWDTQVFPYAWFWIEANAASHWPWFGRLYAIAIEPANILPGSGPGPHGLVRGGLGTSLVGGENLESTVTIEIQHNTS